MSVIKEDCESPRNKLLINSLLLSSVAIIYFSILSYDESFSRSDAIRGVYMKWAEGETKEERDVAEIFMRCLSRSTSARGGVSAMPKLDDCLKLTGSGAFTKEVIESIE